MKTPLRTLITLLLALPFAHTHAEQPFRLQAVPAALVVSPTASDEFSIRRIRLDGDSLPQATDASADPEEYRYCIVAGPSCLEIPTSTQTYRSKKTDALRDSSEKFVTARVPRSVMKQLAKLTATLPQGASLSTTLRAVSRSGSAVLDLPFQLYGQVKNSVFKVRSPAKSKKRGENSGTVHTRDLGTSSQRPSRSYKSPAGFNGDGCGGLDAVFSSYKKYLDCADQAVTNCKDSNPFTRAFCILEQCRNTPDQFEGYWRDLNGDSNSTGNSYYKNNFGSETSGSDEFKAVLHPCLYDGAGRFISKFFSTAIVMGEVYPLGNGFLQVFHPAKEENSNLSRGDARLGFNGQVLTRILRDDFGATTVPFTYQQELFKSFPQSGEGNDKVYWVNGVIPVYIYFRPQGVIGIELEARVSPESRFLEVNFKSYTDFGTSGDVGPARDGVSSLAFTGLISLIQSEYRTSKYISLNANESGMLPSLAELSQLEFWPARGGFGPICAQWFASVTQHPVVGRQCSTQVDFGAITSRAGTVSTARDGKDRIVYYRDYSSGGDDGTLTAFPWRNPVLSDE